MSTRWYALFMLLGTIICWVALALVIRSTDPTTAPWFIFFFFYASLLLALLGTFTLLGFLWRIWQHREAVVLLRHVRKTFRQGILFAALVTGALYLRAHSWLTWWSILVLLFALVVIESLFLSRGNPRIH